MPNLHVLMTNHSDINSINLLIEQLPFIKEHYDTLPVESVPYGLKNEEVLHYLQKVLLTQGLDLTQIKDQLGISQKHLLALKNEFVGTLTDEEKMQLKYEAVREIISRNICNFDTNVKRIFYQFYYYHYLSEALKKGVDLVGIESSSYFPGRGKYQTDRDQTIVANTLEITKEKQNCLMLVGATHGIDLIKAYKKSGTIKNSYTHLYCDNSDIDPDSPSQIFKTEIESGHATLEDNQSYLYLELSQKSTEEQSAIFRERVLTTKSKKSVYHEYGRQAVQQKGLFCTTLTNFSGLPFFMSVDKDYNADTVCIINNKDQKQLAKNIQEKTALGTFFKSDSGKEVFVIKKTNAPENAEVLKRSITNL